MDNVEKQARIKIGLWLLIGSILAQQSTKNVIEWAKNKENLEV